MSAGNASYGLGGWFQITITAARGHTIEEIRPVVDQIVVDLQQQGPTLAEVERAKRNIIANQLRTVERIGGFGGKADLLNHYETFRGVKSRLFRCPADVPAGDDWVGLTRAFLHAGARHVVATLWPVDDWGTAALMESFYQDYAGGAEPARALATAQRALIARRTTSDPFYWAGFIVADGAK